MSDQANIQLPPGWLRILQDEFSLPYMKKLKHYLLQRRQQGAVILPSSKQWFHALNLTDFEKVRVVILGQDPYHHVGQAHGLSFSVKPPTPAPPSLINIIKELKSDLHIDPSTPYDTDLTAWATQGVLLLNSVLTVEKNRPASHAQKGWEQFTDTIIKALSQERQHVVFILWGSYAQSKGNIVDTSKHLVLRSSHPSPFSAHIDFFGSQPFSKTNHYLTHHGYSAIDWQVLFRTKI